MTSNFFIRFEVQWCSCPDYGTPYRVSSLFRPLSSGIKHFFFWKIPKHVGFPNNFCSVPNNPQTNHSLSACVCLFLCGCVLFVVDGRRCTLSDVCATLSLWKDLDAVVCINARCSIAACLQCWKIVASLFCRNLRGSCSQHQLHLWCEALVPPSVMMCFLFDDKSMLSEPLDGMETMASQRAHTRGPNQN